MKKQQDKREREVLLEELVSKFKGMNPENEFLKNNNAIYVDTSKLWEIKFPDDCEILSGRKQFQVEIFKMISFKVGSEIVFIFEK